MREGAFRKGEKSLNLEGIFAEMPEDLIGELNKIAVKQVYEKGEMIFWEGDQSQGFYLVLEGLIKIYKLSGEGKEQILQFIKPGQTFGEVVVFFGRAFPAHAEAVQKSIVLFFPRQDFRELIRENPELALMMLAILSERLRRFTIQVENLSLKEVPSRLAGYFLYLSQKEAKDDTIELDISKGQLASLLGTVPETLSRILRRMAEHGIIEVKGRQIRLLDIPNLVALSEGGKRIF